LELERQNYKDTKNQIEYIQKVFVRENIEITKLSFLYKLLDKVLNNYNAMNNTYHEVFDAL